MEFISEEILENFLIEEVGFEIVENLLAPSKLKLLNVRVDCYGGL